MTFSFYQSLRTVPTDLLEAARLYRLSRGKRWSRLEAPSTMMGLVWNGIGLADLEARHVVLTPTGERFALASLDEGKAILRDQGVTQISLLQHITRALGAAPSHRIAADEIQTELEGIYSSEEARRQFETAVDWGRYAELFTYDDITGELRLDEEHRMFSLEVFPPASGSAQ